MGTRFLAAGGLLMAAGAYFAGSHRNPPPVDSPPPITSQLALLDKDGQPATSLDVPVSKGAVVIVAATKSKTAHVRWLNSPANDGKLQVLEYHDHAQVISLVPGQYWVGADLASADGVAVWCRINAGDPGPVTPPPNKPPPDNPPPPVISPLQKTLQAAYDSEVDAGKSAHVAAFADLLDNIVGAAKAAKTKDAAGNMVPTIRTAKDFTKMAHDATEIAVGPVATAIPNTRAAAAAYLASKLPTAPATPFDAAYTGPAETEHKAVAAALKGLMR